MKLPSKVRAHQEHMWRCDADDHHWLALSWWDDEKDWAPILEVSGIAWPRSLWERIKYAVVALRGRQVPVIDMLLSYEDATEIAELLKSIEWPRKEES